MGGRVGGEGGKARVKSRRSIVDRRGHVGPTDAKNPC